jgi:uncharacterized membrane protein YphA (DoxX/SURF4 family)
MIPPSSLSLTSGVTLLSRAFLGALLAFAGSRKILEIGLLDQNQQLVDALAFTPRALRVFLAHAIPPMEVFLGFCLLLGLYLRASLYAVSALFAVFALVVVSADGHHACGCTGLPVLDDLSKWAHAAFLLSLLILSFACAHLSATTLSLDAAFARSRKTRIRNSRRATDSTVPERMVPTPCDDPN